MDKPKVLIVEDDIDLSHMLSAYFRGQGYDVRTAVWGQEALALCREEAMSLIMLDIRLPDMDGYEVYHHLRQSRNTQEVPVIFLSERRHRVEILQGLELGVVDYIPKPFDVQELGLRVRNAIQRSIQPALTNPVTDLPDRPLLDERLSEIVTSEQPWALLILSIVGLNRMRELQGFVEADELLRAVALIARSAVRDGGSESDVIAHYRQEELVIITTDDRVQRIHALVDARIRYSLMHLFGSQTGCEPRETGYFNVETFIIAHSPENYHDVHQLQDALAALLDRSLPAEAGNER